MAAIIQLAHTLGFRVVAEGAELASQVEMLEQMLPTTDREVTAALTKSLQKQGMTIHAGTRVTGMEPGEETVTLTLEGKVNETLTCDRVLVAAGRRPPGRMLFTVRSLTKPVTCSWTGKKGCAS